MSLQNQGDYEGARKAYQEAWKLEPRQAVLANLALVETGLKRFRDAAEHCSTALREVPKDAPAADVAMLQTKCNDAKRQVGAVAIAVDKPGAEILVNGKPVGTSPLIDSWYVEPGHLTIEARLGDRRSSPYAFDVEAGSSLRINLEIPDAPPVPKAEPHPSAEPAKPPPPNGLPPSQSHPDAAPRSPNLLVPSIIGGGLTLTGLALGIAFGAKATSSGDDAQRFASSLSGQTPCSGGPATNLAACQSARSAENDSKTFRNISTAGYIGAGIAAAGTIAYVLLARPKSSQVTVTPVVGPTQAHVVVQSTF